MTPPNAAAISRVNRAILQRRSTFDHSAHGNPSGVCVRPNYMIGLVPKAFQIETESRLKLRARTQIKKNSFEVEISIDINSSRVANTSSPSGLAFKGLLAQLAQAGLLLA